MNDNVTPFTPKFVTAPVETTNPVEDTSGFVPFPTFTWEVEYKDSAGNKATEQITGVLKFNPPFLVVVPVDAEESHLHDADFMVMLSNLNNVKKITQNQVQAS